MGREAAKRSMDHKREPAARDQIRKATQGIKDRNQISQAGAERLDRQESSKGNDRKPGKKIESEIRTRMEK